MEEQVAKLVSRFFYETERNGVKGQFGFPFPKFQLTVWSLVSRGRGGVITLQPIGQRTDKSKQIK